jgi:hypothetical protein
MMSRVSASRFAQAVLEWLEDAAIDPSRWPAPPGWAERFGDEQSAPALRPGADLRRMRGWEQRFGFSLPLGLRAWLLISDGLYKDGPLVHPLTAIGPMIPFASVPDLLVQPESWFELGNPGTETICIDLAYRWPSGDCPVFCSGDDARGTFPRIIAPSFDDWLLRLLGEGGREYWLDAGFVSLGDPWAEHRKHTPAPDLPERLRPLATRVKPLVEEGADDRNIATALGISRGDVETIFRHLQHVPAEVAGS